MRALLAALLGSACSSSVPPGLHAVVVVDVRVADTPLTIDGEPLDPGTANPGHGVSAAFDLDAWSDDVARVVTASGAVTGSITVPANPCAAVCAATACDLSDVRVAWTQVEVTTSGLALGCVRCDSGTGAQLASQCPP
jgi:hypothetical protein